MKKTLLASAVAAATVGGAASADILVVINNTFAGWNFDLVTGLPGQYIFGNLTGASINVTLTSATNYTYADDLCIYVDPLPLSTGGLLQCGGFSNLGASQRYYWPNGGSSAPGTTSVGTVNFTSPIFIDQALLGAPAVYIGNGYGAAGTSGTWTGTITLHGVNFVPAPGAAALLGLAGFASRRRRR